MSWQAAMDALARYGGCLLDADGGTHNQIINTGTPSASQVLDKRGFIALITVTETTITAINYDKGKWSGDAFTKTFAAGSLIPVNFHTLSINAGVCLAVASGQGTYTNGTP